MEFFELINEQGFLEVTDKDVDLDLDSLSIDELSSIRVVYKNGKVIKHFLGALLYKNRAFRSSINTGGGFLKKSLYNLDSIDLDRIDLLKGLVSRFLDGEISNFIIYNVLVFFEWLDLEEKLDISTGEKDILFDVYVEYTERLISHRSQSNINKSQKNKSGLGISYGVARARQQAAIVAIELLSKQISASEVSGWAINLKQSSGSNQFKASVNYKDFLSTRDFHLNIFNSIYEHIFSKSFDAYVVKEDEDIGLKKYVIANIFYWDTWKKKASDSKAAASLRLIYDEDGKCLYNNYEDLVQSLMDMCQSCEIDKDRRDSAIHFGKRIFHSDYKSMKGAFNKFLYDVAIKSFCHVFLLDTGANADSLGYLKLVRARGLEKSGKSRVLSFKGKIKEKIELKITAKMIPIWNKMIDLHVLMCGDLEGFVGMRRSGNNLVTTRWVSSKIGFFDYILPSDFVWVSAKKWRDLSSYITLSTTNDIVYSASRHNHTPETAQRHYVKLDNLRAIKVNHNYFKEMANQMKLYADGKIIPVKLLKDK